MGLVAVHGPRVAMCAAGPSCTPAFPPQQQPAGPPLSPLLCLPPRPPHAFASNLRPHPFRSAKACWLAGHYADIEFGDGQGKGPTFSALLQRVVAAIGGERRREGGGGCWLLALRCSANLRCVAGAGGVRSA